MIEDKLFCGIYRLSLAVLVAGSTPSGLVAQNDIVFANHDGQQNRICLGDGHGGFSCSDVSGDSDRSGGVALGFIDGDRRLDAVFANSRFDSNRVCLGDGSGGFSCSDVSGKNQYSEGVALGYVDGDANIDAIFTGDAEVCLGNGAGDFSCSDFFATIADTDVALGFVDGDSNLDAIFSGGGFFEDIPEPNAICLGSGHGDFSCSCIGDGDGDISCALSSGNQCTEGVALGKVDGDDHLDAVFANRPCCTGGLPCIPYGGENVVCLGDGEGGFSCSNMSHDTNYSRGVELGFVDDDNNLDAVFATNGEHNRVCLGDGSGGFSCSDVSGIGGALDVALGFIDDDADLDAVFAHRFGRNRVCLGDGKGDFSCSDVSEDTNFTHGVALGQVRNPDIARFLVTKYFSDDNTTDVEVTLSCNTGLPLEQTTTIAEGDPVNFVVGDFEQGTLNCTVTELVPAGYSVFYTTRLGGSEENCSWEDLQFGQFVCQIENTLEEVEIEVTKVWIDEHSQFNPVNVAEAYWLCQDLSSQCEGIECNSRGSLSFNGNPDTDYFTVLPDWQAGTRCTITEVNAPDASVENNDSECQDLLVFPGVGASCTIFNTRLFEGIPILSQFGLRILALMMLGLGFIAFRRFS